MNQLKQILFDHKNGLIDTEEAEQQITKLFIVDNNYIQQTYSGDNICNFCGKNIKFPEKQYNINGKPACLSCSCDDDLM